ncbi:hypothetical protein, partial [Enterococcus faecium]|uniref:hypothetical protein n=1 Tax=Enterococcus faecium TaxID=1352 RepID=UPI003D260144
SSVGNSLNPTICLAVTFTLAIIGIETPAARPTTVNVPSVSQGVVWPLCLPKSALASDLMCR